MRLLLHRFWHRLSHDYTLDAWHCGECKDREKRFVEQATSINAHAAAQKQSMDYYMKELAVLKVQLQAMQDAFKIDQSFAVEEAEAIKVLGEDYFA